MPILIECPNCHKQLRVQDTMLGKRVKCPSCMTIVAATAPGSTAPAPPPRSAPPPPPVPPPAAPPPPREEVVDYEGDDDTGDDRDERRRRKKKKTRRAGERVKIPAIFMLVLGILGAISVLIGVVMTLLVGGAAALAAENIEKMPQQPPPGFGANRPDPFGRGMPQHQPDPEERAEMASVLRRAAAVGVGSTIVTGVVGLLFNGLIIFGSITMLKRSSYGLSVTATILTMLTGLASLVGGIFATFVVPCLCLVPLIGAANLGIGIWALVVLMSADVKASFS